MRLSLTRRSEYGVRMVLHLACRPRNERVTAADLAEICDVPRGHVPTIVNILSRAGILQCSPGRGGGCTLARDPDDISMLEVVESLEGSLEISHCLLDSRRCHGKDPECAVHEAWSRGRDAAIASLANTSLLRVVTREQEIAEEQRRRRRPRASVG